MLHIRGPSEIKGKPMKLLNPDSARMKWYSALSGIKKTSNDTNSVDDSWPKLHCKVDILRTGFK